MMDLHVPQALPVEQSSAADEAQFTMAAMVMLMLAGIALLYTVGLEQGSIMQGLINSQLIHEFVHDPRHIAGFPCH